MKENGIGKRELGKSVLASVGAIGVGALLFIGFAQVAMASELGRTESIPTSYEVSAAPEKSAAPAGYVKAEYHVLDDDLMKEKPGAKDLTREEAAELGARMVWELFGADLDGAYIYMGYSAGTETFPRAFWSGDIRFSPERTPENPGYGFSIDAVTGERFTAAWGRILDEDVPLVPDMELAANPGEYLTLARETAERLDLVHGVIQSVEYGGQGYGYNDPSIAVTVTGANGEKGTLDFSRYDRKLVGAGYDAERRISESALAQLMEELERKRQNLPQNEYNESARLVAIP